jgi:hypothetical protein
MAACFLELQPWKFISHQSKRRSFRKLPLISGRTPKQLVIDAAIRLLEEDFAVRAAVRKGIEQADRGEFIEEEEMDARVKRMFEP